MINNPMGPSDEIIVPGDLGDSCNIVSYIGSFEGNTYRSICDLWGDSDSGNENDSESETNIKINSPMGHAVCQESLSGPGGFLQCGYIYLVSWW